MPAKSFRCVSPKTHLISWQNPHMQYCKTNTLFILHVHSAEVWTGALSKVFLLKTHSAQVGNYLTVYLLKTSGELTNSISLENGLGSRHNQQKTPVKIKS